MGVLWDPSFPPAVPELTDIEAAARSLRVGIRVIGVLRHEEFEGAILAMTRQRAGPLILVAGLLSPRIGSGLPPVAFSRAPSQLTSRSSSLPNSSVINLNTAPSSWPHDPANGATAGR